jgi:hypothetical protein
VSYAVAWMPDPCQYGGLVLADGGATELVDPLDANERQEGLCRSLTQVVRLYRSAEAGAGRCGCTLLLHRAAAC